MSAPLIFVTGGTRSGKSGYAQSRCEALSGPWLYVATGEARDDEMHQRIARHQQERGENWRLLEEPVELVAHLPKAANGCGAILLDCVTLWITNLFFAHNEQEAPVIAEVERFLALVPELKVPLFVVSNEIGFGIVPENRLARRFRDLAGEVNRLFARAADEAYLVVSGLPLCLKGGTPPSLKG